VKQRLFVYGSLRSDAGRLPPAATRARTALRAGATREGAASLPGRLHAVSWYPAFCPGPAGKVAGETWLIHRASLLARLDRYEGAAYVRERRFVRLASGARTIAWVYRYTRPLEGVPAIPSGDYVEWRAKRTRP
jgi:gamma-glutamylcyclotransferase (GGCT)/AIG2-like uncharacterized protein YtfP